MRMVVVWIHLTMAAVWLGSMVFLALGVIPVLRRYRDVYTPVLHATGLRLRWLGWTAIGVLLLTGIANLAHLGYRWSDVTRGHLWEGSFGHTLAVKLVFVGLIIVLNLFHDLWLGPRFTRLAAHHPDDPALPGLRRAASWIGRLTVLATLVVFYLAVHLARGGLPHVAR